MGMCAGILQKCGSGKNNNCWQAQSSKRDTFEPIGWKPLHAELIDTVFNFLLSSFLFDRVLNENITKLSSNMQPAIQIKNHQTKACVSRMTLVPIHFSNAMRQGKKVWLLVFFFSYRGLYCKGYSSVSVKIKFIFKPRKPRKVNFNVLLSLKWEKPLQKCEYSCLAWIFFG